MTKSSGGDKLSRSGIGIVAEELTEDNYENWKICLKHFWVGHGVWGVVSGKEPEPSKNKKQEHEEWKKKNALALHAIQLSCGPSVFKEAHISAQVAWNHLAKKIKHAKRLTAQDHEDENHIEDEESKEYLKYVQLYKAIDEGHLDLTKSLLEQDPNAIRARISSHKDTALHIAILAGHMKIAEELVKKMQLEDLEMINEYGYTALSLAAINGETKLAKALVEKNHKLVSMTNDHEDGQLPIIVSALYGQKHMVHYLYKETPKEELNPERGENGVTLLYALITAEIYGVMVHSSWGSSRSSNEDDSIETQQSSMLEEHNIEVDDLSDDEISTTWHGEQNITSHDGADLSLSGHLKELKLASILQFKL